MRVRGLSLRQRLSSGPDGVRYLATDEDARTLLVDRLETLRERPERWEALKQRMALVADIKHPCAVPLLQYDLDAPVPYLVSAHHPETLAAWRDNKPQLPAARVREWLTGVAAVVALAHRLGVIVGLGPARLWRHADHGLWCDLAGVQTGSAPLSPFEQLFVPPEQGPPSLAGDVYALGALWRCLQRASQGDTAAMSEGETALLERMLAAAAPDRPAAAEVCLKLLEGDNTRVFALDDPPKVAPATLSAQASGSQVGRFTLGALLGEGGMGRVFRAVDRASGEEVALKLLHPNCVDDKPALKRFYREAGLLSQLDNPFIARFVEVNQDGRLHFLAMELVSGESLYDKVSSSGPLDERLVLSVLRDMACALADVHDLGVVHRDIKPANVLLTQLGKSRVAKLCDFGIARQMGTPQQVVDRVTKLGTAVGTPQYMSPEQCVGGQVDARSDIYALGITAYEIITGVLPFQAPTVHQIVMMQLNDPPPPLRDKRPQLRDATVALIEKMLAKNPADRYPNARALLQAVEGVRRGAAERIQLRPAAPAGQPNKVLSYDLELSLRSAPAALWPHVSNTERLNHAAGIGAVEFYWHQTAEGQQLRGKMRAAGMNIDWHENPFEWVVPKRLGVLREYDAGPLEWLRSTTQLSEQNGGTLLRHRVEVLPRNVMGKVAAAMEIGVRLRRGLERVYRSIDNYVQTVERSGTVAGVGAVIDPFEPPPDLAAAQRDRLAVGRTALQQRGVSAEVAGALIDYLQLAPAQAVGNIRPRAFAREYGLQAREVLHACFYGTKEGLLDMMWSVLCPRCQVPASLEQSLSALKEHAHCEACVLDYDVDFGRSIEVIFAAHPSVREAEQRSYCVGGPAHRPHVIAQVQLAAGARFAFDLKLADGNYQIAARELPNTWSFAVTEKAPLSQWEVSLRKGLPAASRRTLASGRQQITLSNDYDMEIVVRIEQTDARRDAITATEAACSSLFRELFPSERLAPGLLLNTDDVALLQVALHQPWQGLDEAEVFAALTEMVHLLAEQAEREGGAVVKILGDGVLATFPDTAAAVRAAARLLSAQSSPAASAASPPPPGYRAAVHSGAALVTSINDRLDYFGRVLRDIQQLLAVTTLGELAVSERAQLVPEVNALIREAQHARRVIHGDGVVGLALQVTGG